MDAEGIRILDICGIIYSKNLIHLLLTFPYLTSLKLSRVYLETDQRLEISSEDRNSLPKLESLSMRFLKTIHKTPGSFELGRNTETFGLTSSDYFILGLLNEFQLGQLKSLEIYHDMSEEVRGIRNSDMIERHRAGNIELINQGTEFGCRILTKLFFGNGDGNSSGNQGRLLKKLYLDNLPILSTSPSTFLNQHLNPTPAPVPVPSLSSSAALTAANQQLQGKFNFFSFFKVLKSSFFKLF